MERVETESAESWKLQIRVRDELVEGGVRDGWNDGQYAARIATWLQVELADLMEHIDLPGVIGVGMYGPRAYSVQSSVQQAAAFAVQALGAPEIWDGTSPNLETAPEVFEQKLVDLAIPILALADVLGIDLMYSVQRRLEKDGT